LDSDSAPVGVLLASSVQTELIIANVIILVLIICSALMSASEIAFFSLSKVEVDHLRESDDGVDNRIAKLADRPRYLLSTILITNNLVNIGVIVTSYFVTRNFFDLIGITDKVVIFNLEISRYVLEFVWNVVVVTFMLVLFGEAAPKVFASQYKLRVARFMSGILVLLTRFFKPINYVLVNSTQTLEKRLKHYNDEIDIEEINKAIEITVEKKESKQDARLLKGIVHFGNITVKQIMRPRTEVSAVNKEFTFKEVMAFVIEMGYSRFPVFEETLDTVVGVLNVKDLLAHLHDGDDFNWQQLIREPFFVPETKKIDDLLRDIQENRKHLAIVVDEYGGTSGIITLEDIVEEVVGDIKDEFDETADANYRKLDDRNFIFEGKIALIDVCRALNLNADTFDEVKGEAETLGGLLLELASRIPKNGEELRYAGFRFMIISVTNNRIQKVKVTNEA
jgi:gliding motility-associated protein GldE